ncbi:hypothetical protein [Vibrio neptunius]|uniref:hypothetical protein n=1 Tax=Vibrio neptunius TaxID=170651 RepID=UPI003CE46EEE
MLNIGNRWVFRVFKMAYFGLPNPAEFEDVLESFLKDRSFADYDDYHVITEVPMESSIYGVGRKFAEYCSSS